MTELITMAGRNGNYLGQPKFQFSLFSMAGTSDLLKLDPRELSDQDAGVWALYFIDRMYPGITWGDILSAKQKLGKKWWERAGSMIGNGLSDIGDKIGDWGGSAIRLVTDQTVRDGLKDYAAAYVTGGTSAGIQGLFKELNLPDFLKSDLLSSLGRNTKIQAASAGQLIEGLDNKILLLAGGGILMVFMLMSMR